MSESLRTAGEFDLLEATITSMGSGQSVDIKSLTNYLTQEYTFDQLARLEKAIGLLIRGKIHKKQFMNALIKKYAIKLQVVNASNKGNDHEQ